MSTQSERIGIRAGEIPADGDTLLHELRDFIKRFCVFPNEHCLMAVTLWAAHAHMVENFHTTPRLALLSPDPESGKTRVLEILDLLVPESMLSISASPAAIFRSLDQQQITLLFDEVDAIWNKRGKDDNHEDLRSLLNAGYKRGATIPRCVGPKHEVARFKVFCAVALAGLGELPDTIMSRSVIIKMKRRAPNEKIEPFRTRRHASDGNALRDRLTDWAQSPGKEKSVGEEAGELWPKIPDGIVDRNEEIWEPLLAVAEAAGGEWPEKARKACIALCKAAEDRRVSLGIRLLSDLRKLFGTTNAMFSATLKDLLISDNSNLDDDAPWADLKGKPINPRKMARLLKPYGIKSRKVKIDGVSLQGYRREDLWDAWQRWLPPVESEKAEPMELPEPDRTVEPFATGSEVPDGVPEVLDNGQKVPDGGNGNFGLEAAETLGSVPEVPQVPHCEDMDGCPYCAGKGCECCQGPPIEDDYDGPQTGIGL